MLKWSGLVNVHFKGQSVSCQLVWAHITDIRGIARIDVIRLQLELVSIVLERLMMYAEGVCIVTFKQNDFIWKQAYIKHRVMQWSIVLLLIIII